MLFRKVCSCSSLQSFYPRLQPLDLPDAQGNEFLIPQAVIRPAAFARRPDEGREILPRQPAGRERLLHVLRDQPRMHPAGRPVLQPVADRPQPREQRVVAVSASEISVFFSRSDVVIVPVCAYTTDHR